MIWHVNLGRIAYNSAFDLQQRIHAHIVTNRIPEVVLTLEHEPVLTLGANFHSENLLLPREAIETMGVAIHKTDRGGDITYHGPGQLVVYPLLNLERVKNDLHAWLRSLEEVVIKALATWGIEGYRYPPHTGVWVQNEKICAIGVKVKRWVSLHGMALNCLPDLKGFDLIVPCGIRTHGVTSVSQQLSRLTSVEEADRAMIRALAEVFQVPIERKSTRDLLETLDRLEQHGDGE